MGNSNNLGGARYVIEISTNLDPCKEPLPVSSFNFNGNQLVGSGVDQQKLAFDMKGEITGEDFYMEINYKSGGGFSDKTVRGKVNNRQALVGTWFFSREK